MSRHPMLRRSPVGGFTMLELMIALALAAGVLIGLNTFVFSMAEVWGRNRDWRLFDQHARAVTRYLDHELRRAALPPALASDQPALAARDVTVEFGRSADLLVFGLPDGSRLLEWPERPLPDVWCALEVKRDTGLVLYWQSPHESDWEDDPPREVLLSPLVTELAYDYFDTDFDRWETETRLRQKLDGELETPGRLRLTFTYRDQTITSLVPLHVFGRGLPNF